MTTGLKPVSSLTPVDFEKHRVWEFKPGPSGDETWVRPVRRTPVSKLTGRIVAERVTLANGEKPWALIGNVFLDNEELTRHFVTVSIERNGCWFHLARYHDYEYADRGPGQLSEFMCLPVECVFPIAYDISHFIIGNPTAARGSILAEPENRLTRAQLMALAVRW